MRPGAEFRAFLDTGCRLVALCQRDITQHFEGLARDREGVLRTVARFVRRELAPALLAVARPAVDDSSSSLPQPPSSVLASSRLVADLYVHASGKVRLVDLAVPGGTTSPLLFASFEEIFAEREEEGNGNGNGNGEEGEEEEQIDNGDDASDAELSLPSSSEDEEEESEEEESEEEEADDGRAERRTTTTTTPLPLPPSQRPPTKVRFRVVGGARGGIAPGRSLYGAPHDFADGECVEALVERLKATEG